MTIATRGRLHLAPLTFGTGVRSGDSLGPGGATGLSIILGVADRLPWRDTLEGVKHATLGGNGDGWSHDDEVN